MKNAPHQNQILIDHLVTIEKNLRGFYDLPGTHSVADHLISFEEMNRYLKSQSANAKDESSQRAAVVVESTSEEAFVGVGFREDVVLKIAEAPPLDYLNTANLDAYCVLIEEVSHFNLIMDRAAKQRGVSRLELELQAEIDKVILCAATLQEHHGSPSLSLLVRSLFDQNTITHSDSPIYEAANNIAARFWHRLASKWERRIPESAAHALRGALRSIFHQPLAEKVQELEGSVEKIIKAA